MTADAAGQPSPGDRVRRGPWNVIRGQDGSDSSNTLRDLADKLDQDHAVRGVIVIIDKGGDDIELVATGRYLRAKERIAVALHKVAHWIIHED